MDKLQELTEKLYNEGLSKGKEEGAAILEKAQKDAEKILAEARAEAAKIVAKAEKDAADAKSKAESDIRMASSQAISATRNDIENLIIARIADEKISKELADKDYLKEIITEVAKHFSSENPGDIALVLPESMKNALEGFVAGELPKVIGKEVKVEFSKKIAGGFTISPADGGWFISFTDETFRELICEYLRPATRKLLFG